MSYNETHICNLLYRAKMEHKGALTATDLCKKTGLLKSQMNKVLTGLEKRGMIIRKRSNEDKRQIVIQLNDENLSVYEKEHQRILDFVDRLIAQLGDTDANEAIRLMNTMAEKAKSIIDGR